MTDKIKREICILQSFSHPHIIRLYDVIHTPTNLFLIMEYVPGGELFEYLVGHGRLQEDTARRFFQQIIYAVKYCHQRSVVHRDLKPENILLDASNNVKVVDFGLSNFLADGEFLKTSCGSPNYAAPEVISGNYYAGAEVDTWSCGIILYALLCGRLPFDDDVISNLFKKIKNGVFHLPGYLSEQSKDLISKMLVVNPLRRISVDKIMSHPWVTRGLPSYLPRSLSLECNTSVLDEDIVDVLAKLYSTCRDFVAVAVKSRYHEEAKTHRIYVAYQLLHDQALKEHIEDSKKNPGPQDDQTETSIAEVQSFPAIIPNSELLISGMEVIDARDLTLRTSRSNSISGDPTKRPGWYASCPYSRTLSQVGIWCSQHPVDVMTEVYKVLVHCNFEWKTVTPFEVRARCEISSSPDRSRICISCRLYRVGESKHLLDIQRIDGSYIVFLELSSIIVSRLQKSLTMNTHSSIS